MTCTGLVLGLVPHGLVSSAVLLGILGFWAGFFAVPVNALIQQPASRQRKGRIIAAANLLSFVGIAISSGVYFVFTSYVHRRHRSGLADHCGQYRVPADAAAGVVRSADSLLRNPHPSSHLGGGPRQLPRKDRRPAGVCNHMSFVDAEDGKPIDGFRYYRGLPDAIGK